MNGKIVKAIVLAAGQGRRMESRVPKQYLQLGGHEVLYYSLRAFEESPVDEIVLVTGEDEIPWCREHIVGKYGFSKVKQIIPGGEERYDSVYAGLLAAAPCDYVLIHDGARPFVTGAIIERVLAGAAEYGSCTAGMPVKDTIKMADDNEDASCTPDRSHLWLIQTPQAFSYELVRTAYDKLFANPPVGQNITDDAMVVELMTRQKVHLVRGSYENIKVTTPEDMEVAEIFLRREGKALLSR